MKIPGTRNQPAGNYDDGKGDIGCDKWSSTFLPLFGHYLFLRKSARSESYKVEVLYMIPDVLVIEYLISLARHLYMVLCYTVKSYPGLVYFLDLPSLSLLSSSLDRLIAIDEDTPSLRTSTAWSTNASLELPFRIL